MSNFPDGCAAFWSLNEPDDDPRRPVAPKEVECEPDADDEPEVEMFRREDA